MFRRLATAALLSIALAAPGLAADVKTHRVAIQVNQNDPQVMNLALNNATNVIEYYRGRNEAQAPEGAGIPEQGAVFRLQQHKAGHGEDRSQGDSGGAGRHGCTVRRGSPDGIAGAGLELHPALEV